MLDPLTPAQVADLSTLLAKMSDPLEADGRDGEPGDA